ncbi:hypothetical protein BATDEDRAFT_13702 [Batrachochytrium dendrobatidis JAM81]|uniref:Endoplasmic reticulum transmembrane protein n=1 Tax=Batrachochytrium dendrobatidis (strain JAM81 / FGSC 10211) TaxID=684364 RepID=F4PAM6_BATDJ|nr:uncharacterized protein BATDEDRAFT_13702 [Batrachochytrium dendrobatidis JAM81]EGF77569.1 hypothetical protein BATDEDRAFT_13702 [Batrachochytrium dendrobatidis JAM81]|eukprot:XP_006681584.1 hypothetical protein BATDEDRAFT_13702 [Batrachochytrium dendrobatidis JAM81]
MTLYYQIVFAMLVYEMALFLLLLAPFPTTWRRSMLKWVSNSKIVVKISYVMRIMFVFVVVLFVDSLNNVMKKHEHDEHGHSHADAHTESMVRAKMFYAQRNLYLTGSVVFLSLVLNRFFAMVFELMKNEEKSEELVEDAKTKLKDLEVVKKQAAQTADEYMRLTDRYVELEKKFENNSEFKKSK